MMRADGMDAAHEPLSAKDAEAPFPFSDRGPSSFIRLRLLPNACGTAPFFCAA